MFYEDLAYLCKMSSVNLTKVISKKFQFPNKLRKFNIKGKGLTWSVPFERVKGIFCETGNNVVRLKTDLKDQSLARQSMFPMISSI